MQCVFLCVIMNYVLLLSSGLNVKVVQGLYTKLNKIEDKCVECGLVI